MSKMLVVLSLACVLCISCSGKDIVIKNDPVLNEQLIDSIKEKDLKLVTKLIKKGADPNGTGPSGKNTAFHIALYVNDTRIINLLITSGADTVKPDQSNCSPLSIAARLNNTEIINVLIDRGSDVNHINNNTIKSTALMDAAEANAIEAIKLLIAKGADINILDKWNAPAITIAADKNNYETVELLIESGAELNVIDNGRGFTALDFAIKNKNEKMIALLESKGAIKNYYKK